MNPAPWIGARRRACALLAALLLVPLACAGAAPLSQRLRIDGAVQHPMDLDVEQLRARPEAEIASLSLTRQVEGKEQTSTVRGVRLTALLQEAELATTDRHDWKKAIVLAEGTDGYRVVFSWPELFNTEAGAQVLVIFERDGQPLGEREGRIAIVPGLDHPPGPRSVHWLSHLQVRILRD
jgi:hypothetical protein